MEDELEERLGEVLRTIEVAEVVVIYFPTLGKTLIVDTRSNAMEGPMVKVVPMVASVEERFKSLKRLRPRFPKPESMVLMPCSGSVDTLERLGIWQRILNRFLRLECPDVVLDCEAALDNLLRAEHEEKVAAIKGQGYETLWERER